MRIDSRLIGFTAHRLPAPLSKRTRTTFSTRRSLDPFKDRDHPSSRNSSTEFLRSLSSPFIFRCSASPAFGFLSRFAASLECSYDSSRRIPRTASIRPQVFATSRRLFPLSSLQAYFIPQPRPGSVFVQGLLSRRSHPSSSEGASSMPLLHRRSYTRSDFRRRACRPRATPLGFEASICAGPRSSGPVIHLAQSRSPLRISRSSRFSLSRRRHPLSRLPSALDVTRSIFVARAHLLGERIRQSSSRCRSSVFSRENTVAILVQGSKQSVLFRALFRAPITSRNSCFANCSSCEGSSLTQQARSRPWPDLLVRGLVTFWVFRARRRFRPLTLR